MITRSSSLAKKKKKDSTVKFSLPAAKALDDVRTAEAVPSNTGTLTEQQPVSKSSYIPADGLDLQGILENQPRIVKPRPSILDTVERYQEKPHLIYWESRDARNLFRPTDGETVPQAIDAQIQLLVGAFNGNNWKSIIDPNADIHKEYYIVPGSVADLKEQAMSLSVALDLAKRDKPAKTWAACCQEAVTLIYGEDNLINAPKPPSSAVLQEWYREFRENRYFLSKQKRKEKKNKVKALKKELEASKKENAVLLAKIEDGLPKVKSNQEATDLLAEIEKDMANITI